MTIFFLIIIFLFSLNQSNAAHLLKQHSSIILYAENQELAIPLVDLFNRWEIEFAFSGSLQPDSNQLYVIIGEASLSTYPQNFITYQTNDLANTCISEQYLRQLKKSIVVWDTKIENIKRYQSEVPATYFLPPNYEFEDPVILVCFLPTFALKAYKEILEYSNTLNTDISSHLPTLFCYAMAVEADLIVEAGVRGGESTKAFLSALNLSNFHLIGLDIDPGAGQNYFNKANTTFVCGDDLKFNDYYRNSLYRNRSIGLVFIDTSHAYDHTLAEIDLFQALLAPNGMMIFHDANVVPLNSFTTYLRLNGTYGSAVGVQRGVGLAIKKWVEFEFDLNSYVNQTFSKNGVIWHLVHYPFCNGLTIIKLID